MLLPSRPYGGLDRLDANLKVAHDIISSALTLLATPQRLCRACPDSQRKLLNALIFAKITVDTDGVTGEQLAEPFDTLVPLGRYYTQHGTLPDQQLADTPEAYTNSHTGDDQPPTALTTTALASASSNKHQLVLPAGFELALPPPEAGKP